MQLKNDYFFELPNKNSNSAAIIIKHIAGNKHSHWTNFLRKMAQKNEKNRGSKFINSFTTKGEVITFWITGWSVLFDALNTITEKRF